MSDNVCIEERMSPGKSINNLRQAIVVTVTNWVRIWQFLGNMVVGEPTKDNGNGTNCVSMYLFKTKGETWMEDKN